MAFKCIQIQPRLAPRPMRCRPRPDPPSAAEPLDLAEAEAPVEPAIDAADEPPSEPAEAASRPFEEFEAAASEPPPEPIEASAPAPDFEPAYSAKRTVSAPAVSRAAAACAPAPVPAVILPSEETLPPKDGFEIHTMTAEDRTLSALARSRGITLAELLAANPQIANPDRVRAGQPVYLPIPSARSEPAP